MATAAMAVPLVACIIPDTLIQVRGDFVNPGPVRIVGYTPLSAQVNDACGQIGNLQDCPAPPETVLGLLQTEGPFCVCDGETVDFYRARSFDVLVEDPDLDENGEPRDAILGALLLDLPSNAPNPSSYVAYPNLLSGTEPAANYQLGFGGYGDSIERPSPQLRSWTLGRDTGVVDLCNDNIAVPDGKLAPGLHSLRLVVTDRPWYRPIVLDAEGHPVYDADGRAITDEDADPLIGVPDTAAGASYAIADYVFQCHSLTENEMCICE
jgi:hypothetical protein